MAWIPNIITLLVMLGVGGKHLVTMPASVPASAATLLSYSSTVTSSVLSWSTIAPDYGIYHCGKASRSVRIRGEYGSISNNLHSLRIFFYTYSAFLSASVSA